MIFTSDPIQTATPDVFNYLRERLGLTEKAINLGVRQAKSENAPLPIILWSLGLLSLSQYKELIDWQNENQ